MIETQGLTKTYGRLIALNQLTLEIPAGQIFGFIGPNGAGKTTTMRILATLLEPTAGRATVDGKDVMRNGKDVRRVVGYMPDFIGVYDDLKVFEYLEFFAAAFDIDYRKRKAVVDGVLELTDLSGKAAATVDSLSRGMQQRLSLARVLVHDPKVLILDEPASGLDPRARIEIRELLRELKSMGKTIMISSHILSELEEICDQVGIVEHGRLVFSGTMDGIHERIGLTGRLRVTVAGGSDRAVALLQACPEIRDVRAIEAVAEAETPAGGNGDVPAAAVEPDAQPAETVSAVLTDRKTSTLSVTMASGQPADGLIARVLVGGGVDVLTIVPEKLRLDEAFLHLTQGLVH